MGSSSMPSILKKFLDKEKDKPASPKAFNKSMKTEGTEFTHKSNMEEVHRGREVSYYSVTSETTTVLTPCGGVFLECRDQSKTIRRGFTVLESLQTLKQSREREIRRVELKP